jgi:hypothetical protein
VYWKKPLARTDSIQFTARFFSSLIDHRFLLAADYETMTGPKLRQLGSDKNAPLAQDCDE